MTMIEKAKPFFWIFYLSDSIFKNAAFKNTEFLVAIEPDIGLDLYVPKGNTDSIQK